MARRRVAARHQIIQRSRSRAAEPNSSDDAVTMGNHQMVYVSHSSDADLLPHDLFRRILDGLPDAIVMSDDAGTVR